MVYDNLTIVIQGPWHNQTLDAAEHYKQYCEVIISAWEAAPTEQLQDFKHVVIGKFAPRCYNRGNVYLQSITTLAGLLLVDTPFVIKVRSDEYFKDLGSFIHEVRNRPTQIVTSNAYMRKGYPFHISDHIIGSLTDNLIGMYGATKRFCEGFPISDRAIEGFQCGYDFNFMMPTESILFTRFLEKIGEKVSIRRHDELIPKYWYAMDSQHFVDFVFRSTNFNHELRNHIDVARESGEMRKVEEYLGIFGGLEQVCQT